MVAYTDILYSLTLNSYPISEDVRLILWKIIAHVRVKLHREEGNPHHRYLCYLNGNSLSPPPLQWTLPTPYGTSSYSSIASPQPMRGSCLIYHDVPPGNLCVRPLICLQCRTFLYALDVRAFSLPLTEMLQCVGRLQDWVSVTAAAASSPSPWQQPVGWLTGTMQCCFYFTKCHFWFPEISEALKIL